MESISVSKFKATCLEVLRKVRQTGQPVLVTKHGEPVAEIVPPSPREKRESWLGFMHGSVQIHGDIVSPVAKNDWEALHSDEREDE
jgi:prevent-host-death family protein